MRLTKVFGLAALAAVAAMAFIGVSSASAAIKHSVVLCDQLVAVEQLCPEGHLWPKGTIILALAEGGVLKAGGLEVKCPHTEIEAKTTAEAGLSLPFEITKLKFGKLETELGKGCEGCTEIHTTPPYPGKIEVEAIDKFYFQSTGEAELLHCTIFNVTCKYGSENILSLIHHDGTHPKHEGTNLPHILIRNTLVKIGGSGFCPAEGTWEADPIVTLLHDPVTEKTGLGWPALDLPLIEF
jgi:hypothetical protein